MFSSVSDDGRFDYCTRTKSACGNEWAGLRFQGQQHKLISLIGSWLKPGWEGRIRRAQKSSRRVLVKVNQQ